MNKYGKLANSADASEEIVNIIRILIDKDRDNDRDVDFQDIKLIATDFGSIAIILKASLTLYVDIRRNSDEERAQIAADLIKWAFAELLPQIAEERGLELTKKEMKELMKYAENAVAFLIATGVIQDVAALCAKKWKDCCWQKRGKREKALRKIKMEAMIK